MFAMNQYHLKTTENAQRAKAGQKMGCDSTGGFGFAIRFGSAEVSSNAWRCAPRHSFGKDFSCRPRARRQIRMSRANLYNRNAFKCR